MTKSQEAALAQGSLRSAEVSQKVQRVMDIIQLEIDNGEGVYPYNGGLVSKNELARRAGIGKTTLFSYRQRDMNKLVDEWLVLLKAQSKKKLQTRRSHAQLARDWKEKYMALANSHHKTELDLMSTKAELEDALTDIDDLRRENKALRETIKIAGSRVITLV